ncbi:MAG TPA: hypothetical protein QGF58_13445 [Myxococcota bacterium]|nr:hypothetical protein [Myxococcota bacterium]
MRTVELDPTLLGALPPEGRTNQWRGLLLSANLMIDLPPRAPGESPPLQTIRAIQDSFADLPGLQDEVSAIAQPLSWQAGEVPPEVWAGIAGFFFLLLWLTNSLLVAMCGAPVLLAPVAIIGLTVFSVLELNRRKLLGLKEHDLLVNRGELAGLVVALLERDFVCRAGDDIVIFNAPSLLWLRHRRDENMKQELEGFLRERVEAAKREFDAVLEEAPTFAPVEIDLAPVRERLKEAGRPMRLHPEIDRALSGED